jgi:azurin
MYGNPENMFVEVGSQKIPLTGNWKYKVEIEYTKSNSSIFKGASLADHFIKNYFTKSVSGDEALASGSKPAKVIVIKVVKNEMKYDVTNFEVKAGEQVEIVFENPDFMQHNLVIAKRGTLNTIGAAADKLASDPKGAELNYVPQIPEVLFSTSLVNPQGTVKLRFTAPKEPGDYPFICTFPGHWSIMNGVMKVVK